MSRRRLASKRDVVPDPKYNSEILAKFINVIMLDGKKSCAQKIVYEALTLATEKLKKIKKTDVSDESETGTASSGMGSVAKARELIYFEDILNEVRPNVEVRSRRVGGATYQVPVEVPHRRSVALGMRWLVESARLRSEMGMIQKLAGEFVDAALKKGGAIKKRDNARQMAQANAAFAHFNWKQ